MRVEDKIDSSGDDMNKRNDGKEVEGQRRIVGRNNRR